MNFTKIKLSFLLVAWLATAQSATDPKTIDLGFVPDFIDFSPDGRYLVAENENRYLVWNVETATKVLEGKYTFKIGRFINTINIPTGSGYFLFGNEQVFITVDYERNKTTMQAFSLTDGTPLWESDQLDMGVTLAETIISAHAGGVIDMEMNGHRFDEAKVANNFFTKDRFLDRLINYIPEKNAIALNGKGGVQLVDIRNGEVRWTQAGFKGGIGELLFDGVTDRLYAITVPATDGALDQLTATPSVIALDANTGELLWNVEYTGEFIPGYAALIGSTLVLPYLELTLIDTETGAERDGDVQGRLAAARNVTKGLGGLMALDQAMGGSFGASKDEPSKYNRLIPRQLHFDNNGRLCYFTMFNDNGQWGTGGKKGFLTIDIHQDKIEVEKYGVLGNQWTVMQDMMVDGVFYVKAHGNLNRTIIKAIDARSGAELFETNKAKNSADVAKAFNPFIVANDRIIDVVSRGIYVLDAKTGEEISYTTTKDLGVGTVQYSHLYNGGMLLFGTKGVGVMNLDGAVIASVPAKNVKGFTTTPDEELWLLESKRFIRVDARQGEILETQALNQKDYVVFSPSGNMLARCEETVIRLYQ